MKRISALITSLILVTLVSNTALAATHREEVLGSSTDTSQIEFPAVTAGPGLILPDSPFFFMDEFKQSVKLALSIGPRTRSLTHLDIAGERLAELRAMVQRGNSKGVAVALTGISEETQLAVNQMADAKGQGKDVTVLSKEIVAHIKNTREVLQNVSDQSDLDLSLSLEATRESLRNSKILAENYLPQPDLENEIADNIFERLDTAVLGVSKSSAGIAIASEQYQKLASTAAERSLTERQKALQDAVNSKDATKIKAEEQKLAAEVAKTKRLLTALQEALKKAQEALQQGEAAAENYRTAKETVKQIKLSN